MPSIPVRKKPYYLNPLENLEDLLFYICGSLKKEPTKTSRGLRLKVGTLTADFKRTIKGPNFAEVLTIRKAWETGAAERVICSLEYVEPAAYDAARKEEMKKHSDSDKYFKEFSGIKGRNRYLSYEMFVDGVHCLQWLGCELCYETSHLGHGLRTLAKLKINANDTIVEGDATLFQSLYADMEKKVEWVLFNQLGQDRSKWKRSLQRCFIDIPGRFRKRFEHANPAALLRDYIIGLCRIYVADEPRVKGVVADFRKAPAVRQGKSPA